MVRWAEAMWYCCIRDGIGAIGREKGITDHWTRLLRPSAGTVQMSRVWNT